MSMVMLTEVKDGGREVYVNTAYIAFVYPDKDGGSEVCMPNQNGGYMGTKVFEPPEVIAKKAWYAERGTVGEYRIAGVDMTRPIVPRTRPGGVK